MGLQIRAAAERRTAMEAWGHSKDRGGDGGTGWLCG